MSEAMIIREDPPSVEEQPKCTPLELMGQQVVAASMGIVFPATATDDGGTSDDAAVPGSEKQREYQPCTVKVRDGVTVVCISESHLDNKDAVKSFERDLDAMTVQEGDVIIVDFSAVECISSTYVGALLAFNARVKQARGTLRFAALSSDVFETIKIMNLQKVITLDDTVDNAMTALRSAAGSDTVE